MPAEFDALLARIEVRLDNLESHVMRELEAMRKQLEQHNSRLTEIDKLTAIGRALMAIGMVFAAFISWVVSQATVWKGLR